MPHCVAEQHQINVARKWATVHPRRCIQQRVAGYKTLLFLKKEKKSRQDHIENLQCGELRLSLVFIYVEDFSFPLSFSKKMVIE
jgi:hypothetical protein